MLTAAALAFVVNIGGGVLNWSTREIGRAWTQAALFGLAIVAAIYWQYGASFPSLQNIIEGAVVIFSMAVAFYETFLKYFPAFSGHQP